MLPPILKPISKWITYIYLKIKWFIFSIYFKIIIIIEIWFLLPTLTKRSIKKYIKRLIKRFFSWFIFFDRSKTFWERFLLKKKKKLITLLLIFQDFYFFITINMREVICFWKYEFIDPFYRSNEHVTDQTQQNLKRSIVFILILIWLVYVYQFTFAFSHVRVKCDVRYILRYRHIELNRKFKKHYWSRKRTFLDFIFRRKTNGMTYYLWENKIMRRKRRYFWGKIKILNKTSRLIYCNSIMGERLRNHTKIYNNLIVLTFSLQNIIKFFLKFYLYVYIFGIWIYVRWVKNWILQIINFGLDRWIFFESKSRFRNKYRNQYRYEKEEIAIYKYRCFMYSKFLVNFYQIVWFLIYFDMNIKFRFCDINTKNYYNFKKKITYWIRYNIYVKENDSNIPPLYYTPLTKLEQNKYLETWRDERRKRNEKIKKNKLINRVRRSKLYKKIHRLLFGEKKKND